MNASPKRKSTTPLYDIEEIKRTAAGRWPELLTAIGGIPDELLDRKHHPCPKCGGEDRFRFINEDTGAVLCNQCFNKKSGDGLAAICWATGADFRSVLGKVAEHLGVGLAAEVQHSDIVEKVAQAKQVTHASLRAYGGRPAKRGRSAVCRFPVHDESGKTCSEFDIGVTSGKLSKGLFARGKPAGVFLPHEEGKPRLPKPGEIWILVEGVKDAAALHERGYNVMGLQHCRMHPQFARLLSGCHVIIVPDLDTAGWNGALKTAASLVRLAETARIARLPGEMKNSKGDDVRDVLRQTNGEELVRDAIETAKDVGHFVNGQRPILIVSMDEAAVADQVLAGLADLGWTFGDERLRIYQRGGRLVHLAREVSLTASGVRVPADMTRIRQLPPAVLRERISESVELWSDGEEQKPLRPPGWLVQAIHQRGEYTRAIRPLAGIAQAPTLRPDGTLLQEPGYDPATKLIYAPSVDFRRVPDDPSRDDAQQAVVELLEVVRDFPFVDEPHRIVWLALVLTLVGRPAIAGPCPLFVFDSNTRGSGKSMLCDAASIIAFGTRAPRRAWPRQDEEVRKAITAIAMEALQAVTFDNVVGGLGCSSLDAALTGTTWTDRILGKSETTGTLPLATVWMATGNNVDLAADTSRRALICRIESPHEHPEDREDFQHSDLLGFIQDHRQTLAPAAATILRAFFAAGCPTKGRLARWGSYEDWSSVVRGAITWCGLPDPAETRQFARQSDTTADVLMRLLAGIDEIDHGTGLLAGEIKKAVECDAQECPVLRTVIDEICGSKVETRKIGYRLRHFSGRVVGGRRLSSKPSNAGKRWYVEVVGATNRRGDEGDGDDVLGSGEICPCNTGSERSECGGDPTFCVAETSSPSPSSPPCPTDSESNRGGEWGEL